MQDLMNITNANGEVITLFDGKVTLSQAIVAVIAIAVVLFALKVLKTTVKLIVCTVAVCVCLIHFNIASPSQITDAASKIATAGITSYQTIADSSKNIKLEGNSIQINLDDNWVDVSKVTSIVGGESGKATVVADGQSYVVDDSAIIQLLKSFV